jgi:hypothetical protein
MAQITETISQINTQEMVNGKIIITPYRVAYVYATANSDEFDQEKKGHLFQYLRALEQGLSSGAINPPAEGIIVFFNLRMG